MVPGSLFAAEKILNHKLRHKISLILDYIILIVLAYTILSFLHPSFEPYLKKSLGVLFIFLSLRMYVYMAEAFFRSYYFRTPASVFEFDRIMYESDLNARHPLLVYLESPIGKRAIFRAGVNEEEINTFVNSQKELHKKFTEVMDIEEENILKLAAALYDSEKSFANLLFKHGIQKEDFVHITKWIEKLFDRRRQREWWWGKRSLSRMPKVGTGWAYSATWKLDKYAKALSDDHDMTKLADSYFIREGELELMESSLGKAKEANVLLVGPPGVGKKRLIKILAHRMLTGQTIPRLRFKRIMLFNALFLISSAKEKGIFEEKLIEILNDADKASNVVLVIDDFPEFVRSAEQLGSDVAALLGKFFGSSSMPFIVLSNEHAFHQVLEPNRDLMSYFDKIPIEEPEEDDLILILEEVAEEYEVSHGLLFTYGAIKEIAVGTKRYFADGVLPHKAIDLLREVSSWALKTHVGVVDAKSVEEVFEEKTKIPMGEIDEEEKEKLLNLERILHKRVIGQDEAIDSISDSLRRSRADVQNSKRPMGSFLFLGPTGVGKTETAKSLAEVFFEGEENLLRIDMSEYQESDSISRLIGSFETGKSGALSNLLRAHQYGVLLLDEFEKATTDVHDLFLQIFDEGFFSDMQGRRVNARNLIFIATSNAGSDIIFDAINKNKKLIDMKDFIVDTLIQRGLFRPELLNRFDSVVLFHPLEKEHLERVAILMLGGLAERVREKNYHLVINDTLINTAIKYGYDPKFGAREMRRAIQDKIENAIADKIIKGEIKPGGDLILDESDLR